MDEEERGRVEYNGSVLVAETIVVKVAEVEEGKDVPTEPVVSGTEVPWIDVMVAVVEGGADVPTEPVTGTEVAWLVTPGIVVLPLELLHTGTSIGALVP